VRFWQFQYHRIPRCVNLYIGKILSGNFSDGIPEVILRNLSCLKQVENIFLPELGISGFKIPEPKPDECIARAVVINIKHHTSQVKNDIPDLIHVFFLQAKL